MGTRFFHEGLEVEAYRATTLVGRQQFKWAYTLRGRFLVYRIATFNHVYCSRCGFSSISFIWLFPFKKSK